MFACLVSRFGGASQTITVCQTRSEEIQTYPNNMQIHPETTWPMSIEAPHPKVECRCRRHVSQRRAASAGPMAVGASTEPQPHAQPAGGEALRALLKGGERYGRSRTPVVRLTCQNIDAIDETRPRVQNFTRILKTLPKRGTNFF